MTRLPSHIAAAVHHRTTCTGPTLEAVATQGTDKLELHCACGAVTKLSTKWSALVRQTDTPVRVAAGDRADKPAAPAAAPEPVDTRVTTWWCREHGRRVSWHGRDCPACREAHNIAQAIARRQARERAAAPAANN